MNNNTIVATPGANSDRQRDSKREHEFGEYLAALPVDDRDSAEKRLAQATRANLSKGDPSFRPLPELSMDFDAEVPPPDWIVQEMFERGTVDLLSGDTGAGKSILAQDLAVAAITDRRWLNREVHAERVLYLDEENPQRTVRRRLKALGADNAARDRLRYVSRAGVRLGDDDWNEKLRREVEDFRPDLIIVDTVMATTGVEVNDNDSIVALYQTLKVIASDSDAAILLLHHERKRQPGQTRDRGQATMGGRQWTGQADEQITVEVEGDLDIEQTETGSRLRRDLVLEGAKDREGLPTGAKERIVIESTKDIDGALLTMAVRSEGHIEAEPTETEELESEIVAAVESIDEEMSTGEIADEIGVDPQSSTFKRALNGVVKDPRSGIEKVKRGVYRPATSVKPERVGLSIA